MTAEDCESREIYLAIAVPVALLAGRFRHLKELKMSEQDRKGTLHRFATIGALTERGGRVTSGSGFVICGMPVACVGDVVTYADEHGVALMRQ
jgi:hypothetical protein